MDAEHADKNPISKGEINVTTQKCTYHFGPADEKGMRKVSRDSVSLDYDMCIIDVLIVGKSMQLYPANNPSELVRTSAVLSIE